MTNCLGFISHHLHDIMWDWNATQWTDAIIVCELYERCYRPGEPDEASLS